MKRIHIFKAGKHTSAGGSSINFTESDLQKAVDAYDPKLHEAPIVVGHPKDNGPAYGWVGALDYQDGDLFAEPTQVEEQFGELVKAGRFKKVSASFYTPDAPTNPAPGSYYLRHVGFLGATPPAVKGLHPIEFGEAEEGVIEFSDLAINTQASFMKRLREWIIDKFSLSEADNVIPSWMVDDAEQAARQQDKKDGQPVPNFNEPNPKNPGNPDKETDMDKDQEIADLKAKLKKHEDQEADFAERQKALAKREAEANKATVKAKIQALADEGRVLPAEVDELTEYAASLGTEKTLDFGEGKEKQSQQGYFLASLAKRPKQVDFKEHSKDDDDPEKDTDPAAMAQRIREYQEVKAGKGTTVSYDQALRDVKAGKDKEA